MNDEARALRADIRDTRERISGTLDELGDRLNPQRLKRQAKDSIREATIGRVTNMGHSVVDTIRENPIPAAMIGIGLGWLYVNGRRGSDVERYRERHGFEYRGDLSARSPRLRQDDAAGGIGASVSPRDDDSALQRGTQRVSEAVADVSDRVTDTVGGLTDRAQHMAHDVVDTTRDQVRRLEDRFQETLYENPLAVGVAAVALGVAAGLAIPETRKEAELMGDTRDRLMERVKEKAEEVGEQVQRLAERTANEASAGAREEGLMK